jgi:hypothetical protein
MGDFNPFAISKNGLQMGKPLPIWQLGGGGEAAKMIKRDEGKGKIILIYYIMPNKLYLNKIDEK